MEGKCTALYRGSLFGESANFRAMIGYLTPQGRFHCICESNTVQTPGAGTSEAIDEHWSGVGPESEKIFAFSGGYDPERDTSDLQEMLEERLHRNLGAPALARLGAGADGPFARRNDFYFEMDLEQVDELRKELKLKPRLRTEAKNGADSVRKPALAAIIGEVV